jgi:hypothetical protein
MNELAIRFDKLGHAYHQDNLNITPGKSERKSETGDRV